MTALEGLRVLDLSRLSPGPYCSMLLADLGADVLLVEPPAGVVRKFRHTEARAESSERRRAHDPLRRNKRSIALNLRTEGGRAVFRQLCESADIVLESFRPGVVERLGVDYATVSSVNPRIVYCSLSGYGQTGPYRDMVGHDINYIAIAGALGMIGRPGERPAIPQNIIGDFAGGGLMAAFAILAAVVARERTGRGQWVDVAMSDGVLYLLATAAAGVLAGEPPPRPGETHLSGSRPHYEVYETADGKWLSLASTEPDFWEKLCEVVGREDFKPLEYETARYPEIRAHLEQTFRRKTRDQWFAELRSLDIGVAPVYALDEALADAHNQARGMTVEVDDPQFGTVRQVGVGPKFSATPGQVRSTSPRLGEHTEAVLRTLGYTDGDIDALRLEGGIP